MCCGEGVGIVGDQRSFVGDGGGVGGAGRADDHLLCGDDQTGVQVRCRQHLHAGVEEVGEGGGGGGMCAHGRAGGVDDQLVPAAQRQQFGRGVVEVGDGDAAGPAAA